MKFSTFHILDSLLANHIFPRHRQGLFQNSRGSKFIATGWLLGSSLMTGIATGFYVWITGIKDRHILEIYNVLKLYK